MNPYQRIIRDGAVVQQGHIDTQAKFTQLTHGLDLAGKTVLDVGCNLGEMCWLIKEAGGIPMGIDVRQDYIQDAIRLNPDIAFTTLPAERVRGNFDIVIASAMFHYIKDHDRFFNQMARVTQVLVMDVWVDNRPSMSPAFYLSDRGLFIPTVDAFLYLARKYFGVVEFQCAAISPDKSERKIYRLSQPKPIPAEAVLIYGEGGKGKTTMARHMFDYEHLQLDQIFLERRIVDAYYGFSVKNYTDIAMRSEEKKRLLDYHKEYLKKWLSARINVDVVIEGYHMIYPEYREMVAEILNEMGWQKVTWIEL